MGLTASLPVANGISAVAQECARKVHEHFKRNSKFLFSQNCLNYLTVRSCVRGQNTEISVTRALKYDSNVCAAQQYSAQTRDYYYYYYNSYTGSLT